MKRRLTSFIIIFSILISGISLSLFSIYQRDNLVSTESSKLSTLAKHLNEKPIETGNFGAYNIISKDRSNNDDNIISQNVVDHQGKEFIIFENIPSYLDTIISASPIFFGLMFLVIVFSTSISYYMAKSLLQSFGSRKDVTNLIFNDGTMNMDFDELNPLIDDLLSEKRKMDQSVDKLKRMEKMRAQFTANITHELKTPLTSISGYAEMIEIGLAKESEIKHCASVIRGESQKLLGLIDNIITLSKYDDPANLKMTLEEFDLTKLIKDKVDNFHLLMEQKHISLVTELEQINFYGDQNKIGDMINNLVSNGIKYNREDGKLQITLKKLPNSIFLEIQDTGIGITQKDQERIFERFYVVDKSRGKKSGTGLGLSMVKHVTAIHGGTIQVDSKPDYGTTFTIKLPIKNTKPPI